MEQFLCKTKIISGAGAVAALGELKTQRFLLVTDPFFMQNGTAEKIAQITGAKHIKIFDKVKPDPTVELAAEGTAIVKEFQPDTVAALGGGSALDCAKAMVYFSEQPIRLVAIPTTSGSGSEVTDFAVLTHKQVKHPLVDGALQPALAILDSDLLQQLPATLVADCGFDVLAHAVEAYVATGAGEISNALAQSAFTVVYANLPASFAGNRQVRQRIHTASTMAGMAFTHAGLGLCHAMSHSLGGMFHVAHGRLNAILLPAIISCNAHVAGKKYAELARAAGMGGSADTIAVRNLKNSLIRLRRELNLPETLVQAGIDQRVLWRNVDDLVSATLADPCCKSNPMVVEDFLVRRILEEVTGRV